jgi:hypothetical protein
MRYRDASHVDVGAFYARSPRIGRWYRLLGYLGMASVLWCAHAGQERPIACIIAALILVWLAAWYQVVGTLWRSSLVAAILAGALLLSWMRLQPDDARLAEEGQR